MCIKTLYIHKNLNYYHKYVASRMERIITNSSVQSKIENNNHADKKNLTSHNNEVPAIQEALFSCSLYISRAGGLQDQDHTVQGAICNCSKDRNL